MRNTPSRINLAASATALAVSAFLTACGGGGSASAPPDTTAPTVTITDNVSGATATGNVTFTFTFSEAVTGFDASDITVSNGTKGTFTMANDGLSATLVAIPTSNTSATLSVAVGVNAFSDAAGNGNANSATGSQAYQTAYLSFDEDPATATGIGAYGGAEPSVTAAPTGGTGNALRIAKPAGANNAVWGGVYFTVPRVPFTSGKKAISARVYSTVAGAAIKLKVEASGGGYVEVTGTTVSAANTWTTVTWNFSAADLAANYTTLAITPDATRTLDGATYYIDEMTVVDTPAQTEGPTSAPAAPTANAADVTSIFSNTYTNVTVDEWGPDWGPYSSRITTGSVGGNAYRVVDMAAGQVFAGISFVSSKFDATSFTHFNIRYWVDAPIPSGQVIDFKLSNHDGSGETSAINYTETNIVSGSWQTLSIPLSSFSIAGGGTASRNNIAQLIISGARTDVPGTGIKIYIDDIYLSR